MTHPTEWREEGFIEHFKWIHEKMANRAFCFVLGAGASVESGIPAGGALSWKWLVELHRFEGHGEIETWATPENLGIEGFSLDNVAASYPAIFERRFGADPEEGFASLEEVMHGVEPSFGYTVLAQLLSKERHKVVVTTNFDNLVADALTVYGDTNPLVCGHESLAAFARSNPRRPLVAKIHRDLFLAPVNDTEGTGKLAASWERALGDLFKTYTPIFIGYGGNDGSLMGLLESFSRGHVPGRPVWCYRPPDMPSKRVYDLMTKLNGIMVPIKGFDELMMRFNDALDYPLLVEHLKKRAAQRQKRYHDRFLELSRRLTVVESVEEPATRIEESDGAEVSPEVDSADEAARPEVRVTSDPVLRALRKVEHPLGVVAEAERTTDLAAKVHIYEEGLVRYPDSEDLMSGLAKLLAADADEVDRAEELFERAEALNPFNIRVLGEYAAFLTHVRGRHDEAQEMFRRALGLDLHNAELQAAYADFLWQVRNDADDATAAYEHAVALQPKSSMLLANYATFLVQSGGDRRRIRALFERALSVAPDNAHAACQYGAYLMGEGELDDAERLILRATELAPGEPSYLGAAAELSLLRSRFDEAKGFAQRMWDGASAPGYLAVAAVLRGLAARCTGEDDSSSLSFLKRQHGETGLVESWNFDALRDVVRTQLQGEAATLYERLMGRLSGDPRGDALEELDAWARIDA